MQTVPGPGWYTDPWHHAGARWWDGQQWTGHTQQPYAAIVPAAPPLRQARTDVRGGGIALFGFIGANAMSACAALFAIGVLGVPARSVTAELFALVGLWVGIACTAYMVTRRMNATFADLGFSWPTAREFGVGFGVAFLAAIAASRVALFLHAFLSDDSSSSKSNLFLTHRPSAAAIFVLALAACIGAPMFEELFFRGIVQAIFTRRSGAAAAIVLQAVLFGCAHYQLGMTANEAIMRIVTIGVVGLFLGWLRNHTGRLGAGMVMHGTYNLIVVLVTIAVLSSS
jgi:membrane protease YdiL (CAAX protease family)